MSPAPQSLPLGRPHAVAVSGLADEVSVASAAVSDRSGSSAFMSEITPATWGAAIEVPFRNR